MLIDAMHLAAVQQCGHNVLIAHTDKGNALAEGACPHILVRHGPDNGCDGRICHRTACCFLQGTKPWHILRGIRGEPGDRVCIGAQPFRKSIHSGAGSVITLSCPVIPGTGQDKMRHGQPCTAQKGYPSLGGIIGKVHGNSTGRTAAALLDSAGFSRRRG